MDMKKRADAYARQNGRPMPPTPAQRRRLEHKAGRDAVANWAVKAKVSRRVARELMRLELGT